jgi:hypothetical protein
MSTRVGYLSDENMKKICAKHRPVPMDRIDLLPSNPVNTSGLYSRKLKEVSVLKRPAKASYMIDSVRNITGVDIGSAYVNHLEKKIDRQPVKMLPRAFGGVDQQTYTNLSNLSIPDIAGEMYRQVIADLGFTALMDEQFGDVESLPASEVPATIGTIPTEGDLNEEGEADEPVEPVEVAEVETQTPARTEAEYLVEFLRKPRTSRERTIRLILQKYRRNQILAPVPEIPSQPSKAVTEQIFREFLNDIYENQYDFDLDELLQLPTMESIGEPGGGGAGPSTLSAAETAEPA